MLTAHRNARVPREAGQFAFGRGGRANCFRRALRVAAISTGKHLGLGASLTPYSMIVMSVTRSAKWLVGRQGLKFQGKQLRRVVQTQ